MSTPFYHNVQQINALGRPVMSDAQILYMAGRGGWLINGELHQTLLDREWGQGDCSAYAGQGVKDLNHVQSLMDQFPFGRFAVDVGGPDSYAEYVFIGTNDMIAWRAKFIELWGTVDRPPYWRDDICAMPIGANPGTVWP